MHYYKRNIGDYHKKAGRLSMLQHGAYTLLLDACYDREVFPTAEEALEWAWASSEDEEKAVMFVLQRFFTELPDGRFEHSRIYEEVEAYQERSKTNKRIARERETKRRGKGTKRDRTVDDSPPNQEPLTTNQKPTTNTDGQEPSAKPPGPAEVTVATIPTNKFNTEGELFRVTGKMVEEWEATFAGLDVIYQIGKARQWHIDNPTKRKTKNGMRRFLGSWLGRENDKGGASRPQGSPRPSGSPGSTRSRTIEQDLLDTSWAE